MDYDPITPRERFISAAAGLGAVLGMWSLIVASGLVSSLILPPPQKVFWALMALAATSEFWASIWSTFWTWAVGVVVGAFLGGSMGIALGLNKYIWAAVEPTVEFVRALPSVVLVPLVSVFLGVGSNSRLVSTALVVCVTMISTAGLSLRNASAAHMRLACAWRTSTGQLIRYFLIPSAITHMAVALRSAIPIALIVAVAADMLIATDRGVGRIIVDALAVFNIARMYAAVIVVGFLGYAAAILGAYIERRLLHWQGR